MSSETVAKLLIDELADQHKDEKHTIARYEDLLTYLVDNCADVTKDLKYYLMAAKYNEVPEPCEDSRAKSFHEFILGLLMKTEKKRIQ